MKKLKYLLSVFVLIGLVSILAGCTKKFTVTFVIDETVVASTQVKKGGTVSLPDGPSKDGYAFAGWYHQWFIDKDNEFTEDSVVTEDIAVYGIYEEINYTITYKNADGLNNTNPESYTINTPTFGLEDVDKEGFKFLGWYDANNEEVTSISLGTTGDVVLTARWDYEVYKITYNNVFGLENKNPKSYTAETTSFNLEDVEKPGYEFAGWYDNNNEEVTSIPTGTTGNIVLTARFTKEKYKITYNNTLDTVNPNEEEFYIDTPTFYLTDLVKEGYEFLGWYNESTGEEVTSIPTGSTGNLYLVARWDADRYQIAYYNTLEAVNPNEEEFFTDTPTFDLEDLELEGYIFIGWYDADTEEEVTSIPTGTIGDIYLVARWDLEKYEITYNNTLDAFNPNEEEFSVDTPTFYLIDLEKEGYIFIGWYDANNELVEHISIGTTGNIVLTARWDKEKYEITYNNTLGANNPNEKEFYIDTPTFNLEVIEKEGYIFIGWFDEDNEEVESIFEGTTENIVLTAKWDKEKYEITYNNTLGADNPNEIEFYVDTPTFNLEDLEKEGYIFIGWSDEDGGEIQAITIGTIGNIVLTAQWDVREYSIKYINAEGLTNPNPTSYTIESATIDLEDIEKDESIFVGWFNGGEKVTSIPRGTTGNIELEARWLSTENMNKIIYTDISRNLKLSEMPTASTFNAYAYDEKGDSLEITCTIGGTYSAGREVSITLSVSGNNNVEPVVLNNFKVYGAPTIDSELEDEIYSNSNLDTIFVAKDSFGVVIDVDISTDALVIGETITVTATDVAGNVTTKEYRVIFANTGVFILDRGTINGLTEYGKGLSAISIPSEIDGVDITAIYNYAFRNNTVLETVLIPGTMQTIGYSAFQNCTSLKTVTIENGVLEVLPYAFQGCTSLESIVIPETVTSVSMGVFTGCTKLKSAVFKGNIDGIGDGAFQECNVLEQFYLPETVGRIGKNAFLNCSGLTTMVIPGSVTEIDEKAFQYCRKLKTVTLNEGLKKIGWAAFRWCQSLDNIILPSTLETIDSYAFNGCNAFTSIIIPESVNTMGLAIFADCTSTFVINCRVSSKPEGWEETWSITTTIGEDSFRVVWDYK